MAIARIATLCASLCSITPMVGCSAMPHSDSNNDTSVTSDQDRLRYYDETAHYNAVKNLWFGLDDPTADQDKSAP
jgi:hypothetical protein